MKCKIKPPSVGANCLMDVGHCWLFSLVCFLLVEEQFVFEEWSMEATVVQKVWRHPWAQTNLFTFLKNLCVFTLIKWHVLKLLKCLLMLYFVNSPQCSVSKIFLWWKSSCVYFCMLYEMYFSKRPLQHKRNSSAPKLWKTKELITHVEAVIVANDLIDWTLMWFWFCCSSFGDCSYFLMMFIKLSQEA